VLFKFPNKWDVSVDEGVPHMRVQAFGPKRFFRGGVEISEPEARAFFDAERTPATAEKLAALRQMAARETFKRQVRNIRR
jgi:hypothetical protein